MALRVERRDGSIERQVILGCVTNTAVLGPVSSIWKHGMLPSRWGNLVVSWCVDHYDRYRAAPGSMIQTYFDEWATTGRDKDTVSLVEEFLESLSSESVRLRESISAPHVVDLAGGLIRRHQLVELRDRITAELEQGQTEKAEALVELHRKVEIGQGAGINVLADSAAFEEVFNPERLESLIHYPDCAHAFFDRALCRGRLVSFFGKAKVGKSFFLGDMTWRAVEHKLNTAYFEVGDQDQPDVLGRFAARMTGRPLDDLEYDYPLEFDIVMKKDKPTPTIRRELRGDRTWMKLADVDRCRREWSAKVGRDRFKMSCHPNSSISVRGIEAALDGWERDGWHPDVLVIDYADILAPIDPKKEERDQINETWKALRALSQRRRCLVVTATQSDADSYDVRTLTRKNFSGDRRKYDHVSGMIGINQQSWEKNKGIYRLNWVIRRDLNWPETKELYLAACLALSNPCVLSTFS